MNRRSLMRKNGTEWHQMLEVVQHSRCKQATCKCKRVPCSRKTTRTPHACIYVDLWIVLRLARTQECCFMQGLIVLCCAGLCCAVLCSRYCSRCSTTYSYIVRSITKKRGENEKIVSKKAKKEIQEGSRRNIILVGNYRLRGAESLENIQRV